MSNVQPISPCDLFRWPDGTTCYRCEYERGEYAQMSDDFEVVPVGSPDYDAACAGACGRSAAAANKLDADLARPASTWRPIVPPGVKVWHADSSLAKSGGALLCPKRHGAECPTWRRCYGEGCQK